MVILGIDPGSVTTGYAFIDKQGSTIRVLEYGTFHAPETQAFENRLLHIITSLEVLLDKYKPEALSMESTFFAINARSALVLGHVRGAVLVTCKKRGMAFGEFSPSSVKQAVTGKGNASKEMVANMIYARLGIASADVPLDATDALAIAWTYANPSPLEGLLNVRKRSCRRKPSVKEWKNLIEKMGGKVK